MKKGIKIIIPVILIGLLLSTTVVRGAYQVTVGQTFNYDVIKASIDVTVNGASGSGAGYEIDGHQFGENTQITITVDSVTTEVGWTVSADGYSETGSSSSLGDLFGLVLLLVFPLFVTAGISPGDASDGLGLFLIPFWDTDNFDAFEDLADPTVISSMETETAFEGLTIQANYDDSGSDAIFDWYITGNMETTSGTESVNINMDHNIKMAFVKSTGVMNGFRMVSSVDGTVIGDTIDVSMESHIEKVGYNLPAFEFGPGGFIPGFEWFIAIGALGVLTLVPIIIRKYRK